MQQPAEKLLSYDEYFAREEEAEFKSEYYCGEVFAMAGATYIHNVIAMNLGVQSSIALNPKGCEALGGDMKLWVEEKGLITYPDVQILCEPPKFFPKRTDTITNPLIILEVLSKSTRDYDRGDKFAFYRSIPSLREYIMVDQYKVHIEQFFLNSKRLWTLREYENLEADLELVHAEAAIPIKAIYKRVDFGKSEN